MIEREDIINGLPSELRILLDDLSAPEQDQVVSLLLDTERLHEETDRFMKYTTAVSALSHGLESMKEFEYLIDSVRLLPEEAQLITQGLVAGAVSQLQEDGRHYFFSGIDTLFLMGYPMIGKDEAPIAIDFSDASIPLVLQRTGGIKHMYGPYTVDNNQPSRDFWNTVLQDFEGVKPEEDLYIAPVVVSLRDIDRFRLECIEQMPERINLQLLKREDLHSLQEFYYQVMGGIKLEPYFPETSR
jgi:hypothetical protein